jgi:hypothetical protein
MIEGEKYPISVRLQTGEKSRLQLPILKERIKKMGG